MRRIVYTRHDGGVNICTPTDEIISWMSCGGMWDSQPRGFAEIQIERMIEAGVRKDTARKYAHAVQFGGCTTAEALEIIRDRDCIGGIAHELSDDIPTDRWFRDAWRRSHNGGPIYVDIEKAKTVQIAHIAKAIREENKRRERELLAPFDYDLSDLRKKVLLAKCAGELRLLGQEVFAGKQKAAKGQDAQDHRINPNKDDHYSPLVESYR